MKQLRKVARLCDGGGIAKQCEENRGDRVKLSDAMRLLWNFIDYKPEDFKLDFDDEDDTPEDTESDNNISSSQGAAKKS